MIKLTRFLSLAPLLVAPAFAQGFAIYDSASTDKSWSRDAGPVEVRFDLEAGYRTFVSGSAGVTKKNSADLMGAATVGVYGASVKVAEVTAEFETVESSSSVSAEYAVIGKLFGSTIYSSSASSSATLSKSFSKHFGLSHTVASYNFAVGPIPVTVAFEVGSSLDLDLGAALVPSSLAILLSGDVTATAGECAFTCGVGFTAPYIGAVAGVTTEIDFGRLSVHAVAWLSPSTRSFDLDWSVAAVCLELKLKAEAYLLGFKKTWTSLLFEQCWGVVSGSVDL